VPALDGLKDVSQWSLTPSPKGTQAAIQFGAVPAMQVALATIKQIRAGSKPGNALKDAKEVNTVLGRVRYRDDGAVPEDAMQLIFSAQLPRLSPRETAALSEVMQTKGCGCAKSGECPQASPWSTMPFVVQCAPGSAVAKH